ncbi:PhoPQ-activated protein PqaA family protein [Serratia sp. M24T3]|uniref:PhoPQ-activated protein PqaA family protein n=1 Tax=Serratia sp. M24T3 TaxID=932213 RepID=UPI00025B9F0E|nr:PhoPQ-activated protein PqaA family protein [Serratia sp. M24T3]EIC86011.1 hypothetical protein SPM24T3_04347 [Serratia sp. M24T3]
MKKIYVMIISLLFISTETFAQTNTSDAACKGESANDASNVISCYRQQLAAQPLNYWFMSNQSYDGVEVNRYQMISQSWSPAGLVSPAAWKENVTIAIPPHPKSVRALIAVDIPDATLLDVAKRTSTIVISLQTIPSKDLVYQNDNKPLEEDDSIARTWKLYMADPVDREQLPLHVPMAASISQTIRLAKKELIKWDINKFIVTGASKRAWATWLSGISDPDVDAIVPFVIDVLDTGKIMANMYHSYGGNWPIAFAPYYNQGIDQATRTANFGKLMKIEDPLQYMGTAYQSRLAIPKYIVNASGDDFFVPDNTRYYYDKLPGIKSLRMAPNTGHMGIMGFIDQSLVPFVNRIQDDRPLPQVITAPYRQENSNQLDVRFSEKPVKVVRWTATNPVARDFRFACGIKYAATPLELSSTNSVEMPLVYNGPGWQASFVEATFDDGYIATSQVYITPDDKYPTVAPPGDKAGCQTLPGRGL